MQAANLKLWCLWAINEPEYEFLDSQKCSINKLNALNTPFYTYSIILALSRNGNNVDFLLIGL
jgi:hypothetical protein